LNHCTTVEPGASCRLRAVLALACALAGPASAGADAPVTDTDVKPTPPVPRPGYLETIADPVFGTRVTRITGDPGTPIPVAGGTWADVARHHYAKDAAWNADQSLLLLNRSGAPGLLFLDGGTYRPRFARKGPRGEIRWHPREPDLLVFVGSDGVGTWNVRTNERSIIRSFEGYTRLRLGPWEGNLSRDGSRLAVLADKAGTPVAFALDLDSKTKYPDIPMAGVEVDWVSISPLGRHVVLNGVIDGGRDRTRIFDLEGHPVGPLWTAYGRPSHYDLTVDADGEEIAVGVSKSKPDDGRVIARRLKDGAVTVLTPGGYASHTSARNLRRPGWAYVTYQGRPKAWPPYGDEVVAVKLDGSLRVERLAHLHAVRKDYLGEAHAVPSPDGKRVLWAGAWDAESGRPIGAYVVDTR
jgi:hypothetical protein